MSYYNRSTLVSGDDTKDPNMVFEITRRIAEERESAGGGDELNWDTYLMTDLYAAFGPPQNDAEYNLNEVA